VKILHSIDFWIRGQDDPLRSNVVPQRSVRGASWCAEPAVMDIDHDDRRVDVHG
jgi:hypothetical protein